MTESHSPAPHHTDPTGSTNRTVSIVLAVLLLLYALATWRGLIPGGQEHDAAQDAAEAQRHEDPAFKPGEKLVSHPAAVMPFVILLACIATVSWIFKTGYRLKS